MLEIKYDHKKVEEGKYEYWLNNNYFMSGDKTKTPFSMVLPPPNITGKLHIGHAQDVSIQDIICRYKRMDGYDVLWLPGMDHAAIATEAKVVAKLKKEGINKYELGRENFLKEAWKWKDEYADNIRKQWSKMGISLDYSKERFTLDEVSQKAVNYAFIKMYNDGLIYRGKKIINWDPEARTALSNEEVIYKDVEGAFYHLKYYIEGTNDYLDVATTRPETLFGDTAVAVNPKDERYNKLIGKNVILPIVGKLIPIIGDEHADMEKGTGVVKITPAHDPNDFEVGLRHHLPVINVMTEDAKIVEGYGRYSGMDRYEARKAIVEDLEKEGALVKIEDHEHNVGTCYRCGTTVEPRVSKQWFVKMKPLAQPAIDAVKNGDTKFVPGHFDKTYYHWLENIRDWCISRQLWWGHQIPAFYCDDCGETVVTKESSACCPKCGKPMRQDPDTLDTWFSSALWPFSTLGWPEKKEEFEYFYPTDVLVTGYDIIFFWVIRMIFSGIEHTGKTPFHTVLIHGLVRDSQGRKMSKSLGNGVDPLDVIEKYGADALRFTLITGNAPGNDMRFYWERVEASRNFANKVWNASRFIMMQKGLEGVAEVTFEDVKDSLTNADKWILAKVNQVTKDVTDNMDKYELGIAADKIYNFIWEEFCDWYIEMVKPRLYNEEDQTKKAALWTLKTVLVDALKLLHPYMPFVTEEIFDTLQDKEDSIMVSKWPEYKEEFAFTEDEEAVEMMKEAVRAIRNVRTGMNVPPSKKASVYVVSEDEKVRAIFENGKVFFATLGHASEVMVQANKEGIAEDAVSALIPQAAIYMPFAELVDIEKEIERLKKEEKRLTGELKRVEGMLSNPNFVNKAPEKKIAEERAKQEKYSQMMAQVKEQLARLQ